MAPQQLEPAMDRMPLGEAINVGTRIPHSRLNKLVLNRLPLALPPRAETPSSYISGLVHIAPIYITFESLWRQFLQQPTPDRAPATFTTSKFSQGNTHIPETHYFMGSPILPALERHLHVSRQVRAALTYVPTQGLERSARLRADIRTLTGWSAAKVDEQLRAVAKTGSLAVFLRHIERAVELHPEVLLAYAWVLYMALFSGGRIIRANLEGAGSSFWKELPRPIRPLKTKCQPVARDASGESEEDEHEHIISDESHQRRNRAYTTPPPTPHRANPLAFFHFETSRDGEDLKLEFKRRLAEASALLSDDEQINIVREADCIFENMISIISQLDSVCGTALVGEDNQPANMAVPFSPHLSSRFRDSIAVSKERKARAAMKRYDRSGSFGSSESESPAPAAAAGEEQVAEELREAAQEYETDSPGTGPSVRFTSPEPIDIVRGSGEPLSKFPFRSTDGAVDTNHLLVGKRPLALKLSLSESAVCVALVMAVIAWVCIRS